MPSKWPLISIPKDPSLQEKLETLSDYAKTHHLTSTSGIIRNLIDEGYDAIRQRELHDALTINAAMKDDSISEAALSALVKDSDLD